MGNSNADERRLAIREAVLKGAQIIFDDSAIDCLVLDVSETGAKVRTASVVPIPEQVILRFRSGAIFPAVRQWTRGMEIGFSFDETASLSEDVAGLALQIYESVRATTIEAPFRLLRDCRFFDDIALRTAAQEAEAALRRLETTLRALAAARR